MKKVLGLSLFAAVVIALGLTKNGIAQVAPYHTTVSVSATTAPVSIPPSVACRITNPGTGYTGSVAVKYEASNTSVPIVLNLNLDSGAAPLTAFTPSAGASGYIIFPGAQGTLQFIGTGGSSSTTLTLDCNTLAPSIAQILPLPLAVAKGGTGTASPNPTVSGCGSYSGTWPSQLLALACGGGFPWALQQRGVWLSSNGTSISISYGVTATAGHTLLAAIVYDCSSGNTISTPSGWTVWGGLCNATNSQAIEVLYKLSASGSETGFSANFSSGSHIYNAWIYEFAGSRTPDKFATVDSGSTGVFNQSIPALTSPTNGAAVIAMCAISLNSGGLHLNLFPLDAVAWATYSWNFNNGDGGALIGFYQGTVNGYTPGAICGRIDSFTAQTSIAVTMSLL